MRVTIMGHAGLMLETETAHVLVDPILRTTPLASGSVEHTYARSLDLAKMPDPTAVVITHGHFDHFDPQSLATLSRNVPIVTPRDPELTAALRELGFGRLVPLSTWEHHEVGGLKLTATPAGTEVDELGLLVESDGARFWHMSDAEATSADALSLRARYGAVDLLSAKYQPTARVVGQVFRSLGGCFDKAEVVDWLEAACAAEPQVAFPYAAGVRFCGEHAWLNPYACPFTQGEVASLLSQRLGAKGRAAAVMPGDIFEIVRHDVRHVPQGSPFVCHASPGSNEEPAWEPFERQGWQDVASDAEAAELERRLEETLREPMAKWLGTQLAAPESKLTGLVDDGVVWQLAVHVKAGQRLTYSLDFGDRRLSLRREAHPNANFFTHIEGRALLATLAGTYHPDLLFTLGYARSYEKIVHVRGGKLWSPPEQGWDLFERLPDPLVYYLRRYAPRS